MLIAATSVTSQLYFQNDLLLQNPYFRRGVSIYGFTITVYAKDHIEKKLMSKVHRLTANCWSTTDSSNISEKLLHQHEE